MLWWWWTHSKAACVPCCAVTRIVSRCVEFPVAVPPPASSVRTTRRTMTMGGGSLQAVAFLGEAHEQLLLASGSADKSVRVWDAMSGEQRKVLRAHNADVSAVAASPRLPDLLLSADVKGHGACVHYLAGRGVCLPSPSLSPASVRCTTRPPRVHG